MSTAVPNSDKDFQGFIDSVKRKTGIDLALYKEAQMKRRLQSLYQKKGYRSFAEYFSVIDKDQELFYEFLDRMTINVSEFYRNPNRWEALEKTIIPRLLNEKTTLKCLSAACSTGEEPYTLALILSKFMPFSKMDITAVDIDESCLSRAKEGVYSDKSLDNCPSEFLSKYFTRRPGTYTIDKSVQAGIKFRKLNLLADNLEANYDIIICRNVMIYFTESAKHELYHKFSRALRPGGVLFVGSTEQIFNPSQYNFDTEGAFFYRRR